MRLVQAAATRTVHASPSLGAVRETVRALRQDKSTAGRCAGSARATADSSFCAMS
jgi:hypothetical protein